MALRNSGPISAVVTVELSRIMGNMTYTSPMSKSSSALRGENLLPTRRDLEFTRKKFGVSSMSSAAFMGTWNCLISPLGMITLVAAGFPCLLNIGVARLQEM